MGSLTADGIGKGMFIAEEEITESMDGKELHIYLPYLSGYESTADLAENTRTSSILTKILESCGINPVSGTPVILESLKTATFDGSDVICS